MGAIRSPGNRTSILVDVTSRVRSPRTCLTNGLADSTGRCSRWNVIDVSLGRSWRLANRAVRPRLAPRRSRPVTAAHRSHRDGTRAQKSVSSLGVLTVVWEAGRRRATVQHASGQGQVRAGHSEGNSAAAGYLWWARACHGGGTVRSEALELCQACARGRLRGSLAGGGQRLRLGSLNRFRLSAHLLTRGTQRRPVAVLWRTAPAESGRMPSIGRQSDALSTVLLLVVQPTSPPILTPERKTVEP